MGLPVERPRYTVGEYLRREQEALDRHEYRDGEILLMAGGTPDHSLVIANTIRELGNRLRGKPCRVYDSNLRVRVPRTVLYTYPDATIICGRREIDQNDPTGQTVTNPRVLIEVVSPSSESYDRGQKFDQYRMLESLEEYVLVFQATPTVQVFRRQAEGSWLFTVFSGLEAVARLGSVEVELPLTAVYDGVEFPPAREQAEG